jgi:anti-sigma regulatory factor (Ser/Thr protein kinase)
MTRIEISGRINDSQSDFLRLFRMIRTALEVPNDVEFDLGACTFLRTNAVVLLGGAARAIEASGRRARFRWPRDEKLNKFLGKCDFRSAFGGNAYPWRDNSVPFRHDASPDTKSIAAYLGEDWLGREWLDVSPRLRNEIVGKIIEIYVNAFEHSGSPIGTVSCGQHYPSQKTLTLTVADFGIGIAGSVQRFLPHRELSDVEAMEWAFERGHTTKPQRGPRGLGLKLLRDFVSVNRGSLEVYSCSAYARFTSNTPSLAALPAFFEGTIIHISLQCDESHYMLASESSTADLF